MKKFRATAYFRGGKIQVSGEAENKIAFIRKVNSFLWVDKVEDVEEVKE